MFLFQISTTWQQKHLMRSCGGVLMELLQVAKMKEQVREKDVMSSCPISKEDESNQNCRGFVLLTVITDYGGMREDKAISGWVCRLTEASHNSD